MSVYSEISKEIGWEHPPVRLPSHGYAVALVDRAVAGDREAFRDLFLLYRFAPSAGTEEGITVQSEIFEGFHKARSKFE